MKPSVYVTRRLPQAAWTMLHTFCRPESWDQEVPPTYETLRQAVSDKQGLLCLLTDRIDAELMDGAPRLRVISQCAVGHDNVDVAAAVRRGIAVGNTPGVLTETTADFAFSLLMAAGRRVVEGMDYVRAGRWTSWGLTVLLGQDIHGATLGIIGLGRIGAAVARRARGFEMNVLYHDQLRQTDSETDLGVRYAEFEELLKLSDFVTVHVNLTPETEGLIGADELSRMKPTSVLVNTSRGPVVDSGALYRALRDGVIGAAALDVTEPEPLPADHPLLSLPNLIVSPHIASASAATRERMALMAVENLEAGLAGRPLPYSVTL